jgi:hypothetical protein
MNRQDEIYICTPDAYKNMDGFIDEECKHAHNAWIYDIINNNTSAWYTLDEEIILEAPDWLLVKNKHFGTDLRFLIIFKDTSLKTIRDLRQHHIALLKQAYHAVKYYLLKQQLHGYSFYFNYLPSVFQLHMHVNLRGSATTCKGNDRMQPLNVVINNLEYDSLYYTKALILTKYCKSIHRAQIHSKKQLTI